MLWSSPMSTSTGTAPLWWMAAAVATKVCATVITSSPAPIPVAWSASCRPSVQLPTPTAKRVPTNAAKCVSKSRSWPRSIRSPRERTSRTVPMISCSIARNCFE
jgi:hypothetical protein